MHPLYLNGGGDPCSTLNGYGDSVFSAKIESLQSYTGTQQSTQSLHTDTYLNGGVDSVLSSKRSPTGPFIPR